METTDNEIRNGENFRLDDRTLVRFLMGFETNGENIADIDRDDFPSQLSLPWAKTFVDEMYQKSKRGLSLPESLRKSNKEKAARIRELSGETPITELADLYDRHADTIGQLESSRDIYYQVDSRQILATEIMYGSGYSVRDTIWDTYRLGFPLLSAHVHPDSELPTAADYDDLLMVFDDGRRVLRGILVLCPEGQILALASKDTPRFLEWKKALKFVEDILTNQQLEHQEAISDLQLKEKNILEMYVEAAQEEARLIAEAKTYGDSKNEEVGQRKIAEMTDKALSEHDTNQEQIMNRSAHFLNQLGISIVNQLGICLYWSTDSENFVQFSA